MFDKKLELKKEMEESWLIQRLQKPNIWKVDGKEIDNPWSFGGGLKNGGISDKVMELIRHIFSFDYMGSSEFEWGTVPQALSFLAKQALEDNLIKGTIEEGKNQKIYYLCPKEYEEEVRNRINGLLEDEYVFRLKERCGLKDYFKVKDEWHTRTVGWLELDNGFMFFVDKEIFEKTCDLFCINKNK